MINLYRKIQKGNEIPFCPYHLLFTSVKLKFAIMFEFEFPFSYQQKTPVISEDRFYQLSSGVPSLRVPGVPWHTQILADHSTLYQPGGPGYAHQIMLAPLDFQTFLRPW